MTFYIGFDPTGGLFACGSFVANYVYGLVTTCWSQTDHCLGWWYRNGWRSQRKGKTREMLTREDIEHNLESQRPLFGKLIDLEQAKIVNNADWLCSLNYINFLRDIGRHFSVNSMIKAEGAKQRLERQQGYSFIG